MPAPRTTRLLARATALIALLSTASQAATLQLPSTTLGKAAAVKVRYAEVPTALKPGQMVQLQLIRLAGQGKEDQVYVRKLDPDKGDSGEHDFGPAYFPGRYELRLVLIADQRRDLARLPFEVVDQPSAPTPPAARPAGPASSGTAGMPAALACSGTPGVSGPVPAGAPTPAEVAQRLRSQLSASYAPIAGTEADVCVEVGTLTYRGQQDRRMLTERQAPAQAAIRSWVVATTVTITVRKRHGTETRQRGGANEVFLFFRDGSAWAYRTGRP